MGVIDTSDSEKYKKYVKTIFDVFVSVWDFSSGYRHG